MSNIHLPTDRQSSETQKLSRDVQEVSCVTSLVLTSDSLHLLQTTTHFILGIHVSQNLAWLGEGTHKKPGMGG